MSTAATHRMMSTALTTIHTDGQEKHRLQMYDEGEHQFGTNELGGTGRHKAEKLKKFCLDHIGVDTPTDEYLRGFFTAFDVDHNGKIDKSEFRQIFCESFDNYGAPMTELDAERYFSKLDRDGSGMLSFDEFCILMLTRLKM